MVEIAGEAFFIGFFMSTSKNKADTRYRNSHLEECRARTAKWKALNPEKIRASNALWAANHPEVAKIRHANRRARKLNSNGKLSKDIVQKLITLQKGRCACCGELLGSDYHLDHRMPLFLGGENEDWNMQLLKSHCNNKKHTKHPIDYMQSKGLLL